MLPSSDPPAAQQVSPFRARCVQAAVVVAALSECLASHAAVATADAIYLIDDGSESILLSDRREHPAGTASLVAGGLESAARRHAPPATRRTGDRFARERVAVADIVRSAAASHTLDPALIHAVIGVESGYAVRAVSPRGAQGLMQLMPPTSKGYGVTDPFDPGQNIFAGARHLRALLDRFGQNTALALAAYNAGAAAVSRHHEQIPPFAETAAYVPKVLDSYAALRRLSTPR